MVPLQKPLHFSPLDEIRRLGGDELVVLVTAWQSLTPIERARVTAAAFEQLHNRGSAS